MLPPYAMVVTAAGALTLLGYLVSRTSVLAIETEAGDRHIVSGSEGVLLRLCLMVDRVRHGNSIEEARRGLEHIDAELPSYPAFRDAGGALPEPKGLLAAPGDDLVVSELEEELMSFDFDTPAPPITPEVPATAVLTTYLSATATTGTGSLSLRESLESRGGPLLVHREACRGQQDRFSRRGCRWSHGPVRRRWHL